MRIRVPGSWLPSFPSSPHLLILTAGCRYSGSMKVPGSGEPNLAGAGKLQVRQGCKKQIPVGSLIWLASSPSSSRTQNNRFGIESLASFGSKFLKDAK